MSSPRTPPGAGPFGELLRAAVVREDEREYEVSMDVDERHENMFGVVHGGVQMALLDMAMGGLVARTLAPGETTASVSITTQFLAAGARGRLLARARLLRRGRSVAFPEGELLQGARLVARASGVWVVRPATRDGGAHA